MAIIYNIRGTNGSGKTTLARSFIHGDPAAEPNREGVPGSPRMVDLTHYSSPTKRDPDRQKAVEGYVNEGDDFASIVVGSYRTACGGLDAVPSFDVSFAAIRSATRLLEQHSACTHQAVIAEGVISSTVFGSWAHFANEYHFHREHSFAFCYLDTPLEVCLERIKQRQEAAGKVREIKEDLVADKVAAVAATRRKALEAGFTVYDLPYQNAEGALRAIITDASVAVERKPGELAPMVSGRSAREVYRASL